MSHKYIRHQPVISRTDSDDSWASQMEKNINKEAVQPKRIEDSIYSQISAIMNNSKARYSSVSAAVDDMKNRSGLTAYLDKIKNSQEESEKVTKTAQDNSQSGMPTVIQKIPAIKQTIENYIRDNKGNLPIPAILDKVRSIHRNDITDAKDWDDENLLKYIAKLNLQAKQNNPSNFQNHNNLGIRDQFNESELDPSNTDAFFGLQPVKH